MLAMGGMELGEAISRQLGIEINHVRYESHDRTTLRTNA